jgi:CRISPR-associated endonuclease/helicase Cas3
VVVATQCIEAGVDIDLDALITEAAPIDALCQRFGRLNRAGRKMEAYASILATKSDLSPRREDPVYGSAIKSTWAYLMQNGDKKKGAAGFDFGLKAFQQFMEKSPFPLDSISSKNDSPVLLPAHLELLSQTSPIPSADPEAALYLHGKSRQSDSVAVIWRGDILPGFPEDDRMRRLLLLVPPRSTEAIELPVWAVRRWLEGKRGILNHLADIPLSDPDGESDSKGPKARAAFRWKGDDVGSTWILPSKIRPGDTLVVPAIYGGLDEFGWSPSHAGPIDKEGAKAVTDVADEANDFFAGRRFAVRIAPGLLTDTKGFFISAEEIKKAIANAISLRWQDLRQALESLDLSDTSRKRLSQLDHAKGSRDSMRGGLVRAYTDLYTPEGYPDSQGILFVAHFGIDIPKGEFAKDEFYIQSEGVGGGASSTEDDAVGSVPGFSQTLEEHSQEVRDKAQEFTDKCGLPSPLTEDISLAGFLHDAGKADPRFQAWLSYGDPLGPDPDDPGLVLAKSERLLPSSARTKSGLPDYWRHEAFSVRLAMLHPDFVKANDPDLVLWLIGTHHGYGRPFFPHIDPEDQKPRLIPSILGLEKQVPAGASPQSLAFDFNGLDWASLYNTLKVRYGVWELARMEAIIRLADHRASEEATLKYAVVGANK